MPRFCRSAVANCCVGASPNMVSANDELYGDTTLRICVAYSMTDALDEARLHAAFNDVIARHAILRTAYGADTGGEPCHLSPDDVQIGWRIEDLANLTEDDRQRRIEALARAESGKPFDLTNELPLRVTLIRTGTDEPVLLLVVRHICWDDDSWAIFLSGLSAAYRGHQVSGDAPQFIALKVFETATESTVADGGHGADTSRLSPEPLELSRNRQFAPTTPPAFDIAFIGSGIACSMTLLELAQTLLSPGPTPPKLRIAVVERDEQFWCGMPVRPALQCPLARHSEARRIRQRARKVRVYRLVRTQQVALVGILPGAGGRGCGVLDPRQPRSFGRQQVGRTLPAAVRLWGFHRGAGGCRHRGARRARSGRNRDHPRRGHQRPFRTRSAT